MKQEILNLLSYINCAHPLNYTLYDQNGNILYPKRKTSFLDELIILRHLSFLYEHEEELVLLGDPVGINWIGICHNKECHILGPVMEQNISKSELNKEIIQVSYEKRNEIIKEVENIPVVLTNVLIPYALMFYYAVCDKQIDVSKIIFESDIRKDNLILDPDENEENLKNCWYCEQRLYNAIKNGQCKNMRQMISQFSKIAIRKLYPENAIRNKKDLSLFSLALSVRASVHGGLPISTAFALEAYYTKQIEEAKNMSTLSSLNLIIFEDYANRVHNLKIRKTHHSSFLIDLEDYIELNIEEELSLEKIAKEFQYTPYYLSRKYKEEKGITIQEFIKKTRLNRARFFLSNTNLTISQISEHLHFGSVSYFINEFKKMYHITPANYRIQNECHL